MSYIGSLYSTLSPRVVSIISSVTFALPKLNSFKIIRWFRILSNISYSHYITFYWQTADKQTSRYGLNCWNSPERFLWMWKSWKVESCHECFWNQGQFLVRSENNDSLVSSLISTAKTVALLKPGLHSGLGVFIGPIQRTQFRFGWGSLLHVTFFFLPNPNFFVRSLSCSLQIHVYLFSILYGLWSQLLTPYNGEREKKSGMSCICDIIL